MRSQPGDSTAAGRGAAIFTYVLRGAGIGLVILVVFPFYRMLDAAVGGLVLNSVLTFAEVARTIRFGPGRVIGGGDPGLLAVCARRKPNADRRHGSDATGALRRGRASQRARRQFHSLLAAPDFTYHSQWLGIAVPARARVPARPRIFGACADPRGSGPRWSHSGVHDSERPTPGARRSGG